MDLLEPEEMTEWIRTLVEQGMEGRLDHYHSKTNKPNINKNENKNPSCPANTCNPSAGVVEVGRFTASKVPRANCPVCLAKLVSTSS